MTQKTNNRKTIIHIMNSIKDSQSNTDTLSAVGRSEKFRIYDVMDKVLSSFLDTITFIDNDISEARLITIFKFSDDIIYESGIDVKKANVVAAILGMQKAYTKDIFNISPKLKDLIVTSHTGEFKAYLDRIGTILRLLDLYKIKDGLLIPDPLYVKDIDDLYKQAVELYTFSAEDELMYIMYWSNDVSYVLQNTYSKSVGLPERPVKGLPISSVLDYVTHEFEGRINTILLLAIIKKTCGDVSYKNAVTSMKIIINIIKQTSIYASHFKPAIAKWIFMSAGENDMVSVRIMCDSIEDYIDNKGMGGVDISYVKLLSANRESVSNNVLLNALSLFCGVELEGMGYIRSNGTALAQLTK